jgi:hypothetical protein
MLRRRVNYSLSREALGLLFRFLSLHPFQVYEYVSPVDLNGDWLSELGKDHCRMKSYISLQARITLFHLFWVFLYYTLQS